MNRIWIKLVVIETLDLLLTQRWDWKTVFMKSLKSFSPQMFFLCSIQLSKILLGSEEVKFWEIIARARFKEICRVCCFWLTSTNNLYYWKLKCQSAWHRDLGLCFLASPWEAPSPPSTPLRYPSLLNWFEVISLEAVLLMAQLNKGTRFNPSVSMFILLHSYSMENPEGLFYFFF